MENYQHILFATDLSLKSQHVGERAIKIAARSQATLSIVHVIDYPDKIFNGGEIALPLEEAGEQILEQIKKRLQQQAAHFNIPQDNQWLLRGKSGHEIIALVKQSSPDLLVIGSHDRHGLSLLFSSISDKLFHAMPCDILAVKVKD